MSFLPSFRVFSGLYSYFIVEVVEHISYKRELLPISFSCLDEGEIPLKIKSWIVLVHM